MESRSSGLIISAIVLAGLMRVPAFGNLSYFGRIQVPRLTWDALLPCLCVTLTCGVVGGLFAKLPKSARTVIDLFPHLEQVSIARAWTGIEGFMPDEIPVIGPGAAAPQVMHAFGFSAHGFALGPIVGCIVAELIDQGRSTLPIEAFRVDRFAA